MTKQKNTDFKNELAKITGQKLKLLREFRFQSVGGISITKFCKKYKIAIKAYWEWENGFVLPPMEKLYLLSFVFNIEPSYLLNAHIFCHPKFMSSWKPIYNTKFNESLNKELQKMNLTLPSDSLQD